MNERIEGLPRSRFPMAIFLSACLLSVFVHWAALPSAG